MKLTSTGLGGLMHQPQFAYTGKWTIRRAAHLYRPIIFGITSLIVLITLIRHWHEPIVLAGLSFTLAVYTTIFLARIRMGPERESSYYRPVKQFIRGQLSLIGVSLMIWLLASHGSYEHNLWLLYVLATLIISEHNNTVLGFVTLLEVAVLYGAVSYIGWGMYTGQWSEVLDFWQANLQIGINILGIFLVTFVFHYLVRNIKGRDTAVNQYRSWLSLAAQQWVDVDQPQKQREQLIKCAEEMTLAQAELWLPSINDGRLRNLAGKRADQPVQNAARLHQPIVYLRELPDKPVNTAVPASINQLEQPDMAARILVPIHRLAQESGLIAILDLTYPGQQPASWQIAQILQQLNDFAGYARLLLIANRQQEQTQVEKALSTHLSQLVNVTEITGQAVKDVCRELGFDFATISLVDHNEDLIRCVGSHKAGWKKMSVHPITCDDVQSRTVKEGRLYYNSGEWQPWLDRRIWKRYQHSQMSRVWVPIPRPSTAPGNYPALGTIEAGFHHVHRHHIPADLIAAVERYATHVGLAIANAQLYERKQRLAEALTRLHRLSQEIQRATAFYDLPHMEELVGKSAEKLLGASMVMLYRWDEQRRVLTLPYLTDQAIRGRQHLRITMACGILEKLNREGTSYFSADARRDPILVNLKEDGKPDKRRRTFTQRQNIKSFAGLPLLGKSGNLLGFLCINYRRRHEFYPEEQQIIEMFAEQASVALEEIRNQRLARSLAILQERNDLAIELHHQLSQHLFGLENYVLAVTDHVQKGRITQAMTNLEKASGIAGASLEALDKILFSLRGYPNPQVNFLREFGDFAERMSAIYGVAIHFEPEVYAEANQQVQFYLFRIAHEAVNNALRHAKATNISVAYKAQPAGRVSVTIKDNGSGFDVSRARQTERLGLQAMDYFAYKLNSQLTIHSEPGRGTCVAIDVAYPVKPRGVATWYTNRKLMR